MKLDFRYILDYDCDDDKETDCDDDNYGYVWMLINRRKFIKMKG